MRRASNCMASLLLLSAALLPATLEGAVCKSEYKNAPGGLVHTACKPPNRRCKITSSGLSSSKKTEFLKAHNDYRMKVAKGDLPNFPKAADMQKLIWDDELAEVAQALADQCTVSNGGIKHDKYDERFTGPSGAGASSTSIELWTVHRSHERACKPGAHRTTGSRFQF
ncbi:putative antigen 5/SCP domain-containing protein [Ixodes scapularis]